MSVYKDSDSGDITLEVGEGKRPPFLFLLLIAGLGISTFFTEATLVPSVGNNIGPFEAMALILFVVTFLYFLKNYRPVHLHFTVKTLFLIFIVGTLSLPNLADRLDLGGVQLALLLYNAILLLVLGNVLVEHPALLRYLLRFIALGALIAGVWIMYEGITLNASIGTDGPFRSRAHVGIYMTTAFWLILLYFYWPGVSKFERVAAIGVIFIVLYAVAVSGRRSAYLSLFIGMAMLVMSFVLARGTDRFKLSFTVLAVAGILLFLGLFGSRYIPQLGFFYDRVGLIDDRLELAAGTGEEIENSDNFIVLQRQGMFRAVADHPLLGIGWGGFYGSEYSPTGHEMHSTPQRFLAELGIIGFSLYVIYNLYLGLGSIRLFFRLRRTRYQLPGLIFMVAIWSLALSWAYNRSVTERTYWLLISAFVAFESLVNMQLAKEKKVTAVKKSRQLGYYPRPESHHPPPIVPFSRK